MIMISFIYKIFPKRRISQDLQSDFCMSVQVLGDETQDKIFLYTPKMIKCPPKIYIRRDKQ